MPLRLLYGTDIPGKQRVCGWLQHTWAINLQLAHVYDNKPVTVVPEGGNCDRFGPLGSVHRSADYLRKHGSSIG
jgi:hypothetical protein